MFTQEFSVFQIKILDIPRAQLFILGLPFHSSLHSVVQDGFCIIMDCSNQVSKLRSGAVVTAAGVTDFLNAGKCLTDFNP